MISKVYIYGALAIVVVVGYKYWEHTVEKRGAAENEAIHAKEAFKAGERELAKQGQLVAAKDNVEKKYAEAKRQNNSLAAERDGALQRLRDSLAKRGQASGDPSACTGADGDPRDCIIAQCASALGRVDNFARSVANQAVGLQGYAREVCLKAND